MLSMRRHLRALIRLFVYLLPAARNGPSPAGCGVHWPPGLASLCSLVGTMCCCIAKAAVYSFIPACGTQRFICQLLPGVHWPKTARQGYPKDSSA